MSFVHMLNLGDVFLRPLSVCFAGRVGRTSLELGQLKICERHGFNSRYLWKKTNDLLQPGSFNWFQRNWRMQKLEGEPCYGFSSLSVFVWLPFKWVALIFKTRKIIDLGGGFDSTSHFFGRCWAAAIQTLHELSSNVSRSCQKFPVDSSWIKTDKSHPNRWRTHTQFPGLLRQICHDLCIFMFCFRLQPKKSRRI